MKERFNETHGQFSDKKEFKKSLNGLLRSIEPFNVNMFRELIGEYEDASEKVKDEDIYLLIGPTGAGKSTCLHYLAGSTMVKQIISTGNGNIEHITHS